MKDKNTCNEHIDIAIDAAEKTEDIMMETVEKMVYAKIQMDYADIKIQ